MSPKSSNFARFLSAKIRNDDKKDTYKDYYRARDGVLLCALLCAISAGVELSKPDNPDQ